MRAQFIRKSLMGFAVALMLFIVGVSLPASAADGIPGKQVYEKWCIHCHGAGEQYPGTWKLALRLGEDNSVLAQREDLSATYIKYVVRNGFAGMPSFRKLEISDSELDGLTDYLAVHP
jgi:mono/diheme cytochrome c family protein